MTPSDNIPEVGEPEPLDPEDAAEIVQEHLVHGRPVERLRLADECVNTKSCPHRPVSEQ